MQTTPHISSVIYSPLDHVIFIVCTQVIALLSFDISLYLNPRINPVYQYILHLLFPQPVSLTDLQCCVILSGNWWAVLLFPYARYSQPSPTTALSKPHFMRKFLSCFSCIFLSVSIFHKLLLPLSMKLIFVIVTDAWMLLCCYESLRQKNIQKNELLNHGKVLEKRQTSLF